MARKFLAGIQVFGPGVAVSAPGATAAASLRGGTSLAAPTTGTWAVGDTVIGQTGQIHVCIVAGTPGTWASSYPINFTTQPSALGSSAVGTASTAARSDHVHPMPNLASLGDVVVNAIASGDVVTWDGTKFVNAPPSGGSGGSTPLANSAPPAVGSATIGVSTFAARADHTHAQQAAVAPTGLTGATTPARFVGGTASAAPASGTFAVGDFVVTQSGKIIVCTTAGSPGTWVIHGDLASVAPSALGSAAVGTSTKAAREDHVHAMPTLNQLANVTVTSPTVGQTITWNGTAWVNSTPASGGGSLPTTLLHRVLYASGNYEARPTGVAAGRVDYLGPVIPTDWLAGDTWTDSTG